MAEDTSKRASPEQLAWLSRKPPTDDEGQPLAWTLGPVVVTEEHWSTPVEHVGLSFEGTTIERSTWSNAVFRGCRFRGVTLRQVELAKVRFEQVEFIDCVFDRVRLRDAELSEVRVANSNLSLFRLLGVSLRRCVFVGVELGVFELDTCTLESLRFEASKVGGLRATKLRGDELEFKAGQLEAAELTAARLDALRLDAVEVTKLELIDCGIDQVRLAGGSMSDVAVSGGELGALELDGLEAFVAGALVDCRIRTLSIASCPDIAGLIVHAIELGTLQVERSTLMAVAFEQVEAGSGSQIAASVINGAMFVGGRWAGLRVLDSTLEDYLGLRGPHFEALTLERSVGAEGWVLEAEGETYGEGSTTWKVLDGA